MEKMEKKLETIEQHKVDGTITKRFQYIVEYTPDQTYYSPLCDLMDDLEAWFKKTFEERDGAVDMWEKE